MQTISIMRELAPYHQSIEQIESEERLIKAAQSDPKDFEALYKNYYERIANFLYRRVENKELAFELTSNVFYNALNNLSKYRFEGVPFSAWLFRIAGNEVNLWYRKNKDQRTVSIDLDGLKELSDNLEEESSSAETDSSLFGALQSLDPEDMELINMRYFEKRSFKEICDITTLKESAVKMKVYRILEKLKTKLIKKI
jgi:RNA polymerase sigma-70 factor (ECF subfamily)